jgi:predicted CXXCH cytochrome family protein
MRIKTFLRGFKLVFTLTTRSGFLLILFIACAQLHAAQSQVAAVDAICLKCHDQIAVVLQKKFKHETLEKGCLSCHLDCREITATSNRHQFPAYYLKTNEPGLCLECHETGKKDLAVVHKNQLFKQARCSSCHEPHASNSPKRLPEFSHGPFAKRECTVCHAEPVEGKVRLVAADIEELCYSCHEDVQKRIENAKYRHQVISEDKSLIKNRSSCLECHDAHATNQKNLLKKPEQALCSGCHIKLTADKKYVHEAVSVSCIFCHDAHASDLPKTLLVPVPKLCVGCHGANAIKIVRSKQPFLLFEDRVSVPPNAFKGMRQINLSKDGRTGHPTKEHPIYVQATARKAELNCLSCHVPHADESSPKLLVREGATLCSGCHNE